MSEADLIKNELRNFCGKIVEDIEEEIDAQEREVQFLFDELSPEVFKYSDKEFLAEGGMKIISRVKDSASLRSVAMAELKKKDMDPEKILNFYNEARVTALLEHPNIVPVYEIGHRDDVPYFIMKEIQGETLGSILKKIEAGDEDYKSRYSLSNLLNILLKVCDAISYAHSRRIVHLDLKPDNIHVGSFGEVLIIDWGLAKNLDKDPLKKHRQVVTSEIDIENTLDGFIKGTIGYMAPEQARGENSDKDERTDIYSLGAILYSILTQKSPYSNKDIKEAISLISLGEYKPLNDSKLPTALCAVIEKAMSLEKADRYQSVENLSHDIQLFLQGFATSAQEASTTDELKLYIKRHSLTMMLVASFLLVLIVAGAIFILNLQEKEKVARVNAEQAIENAKLAMANEKKAKVSAQLAKLKEKEAVEHLKNFIVATEEKQKLEKLSLPLALRRYHGFKHEKQFEKTLKILNEVYNENIDDAIYWYSRAAALIGECEFEQSISNLKKALKSKDVETVKWRCEKILFIFSKNQKGLSNTPDNILTLAMKIRSFEPEISAHMISTAMTKLIPSGKEKIDFLKNTLKAFNPRIKEMNFQAKTTEKGLDIDLSNNEFLHDISPLMGAPIYKLDLSYCKIIKSFTWLKSSNIEIVNLSGIDSKYFRQHVHLDSLKTLVMKNTFFRYQWLTGSRINDIDFTGSTVDLEGLRIKNIMNLNLCSTSVIGFTKITDLKGLKKIIIPKGRKISNSQREFFKRKKVQVTICECKDQSCKF